MADTISKEQYENDLKYLISNGYNEETAKKLLEETYKKENKTLEETSNLISAQDKDKEVEEAEQKILDENIAKKKLNEINQQINSQLYGEDCGFSENQLKSSIGGVELASITGNTELVKKRQHLLDPSNYQGEVKKPNPGKMPHNEDPYSVDLKIEELEVHKPDVKIKEITTCTCSESVAEAVLNIGDTTEKRLIKIENQLATITRYLYRLGSRVQINCVYYGGQTPFEKYKCIRCLMDDRISDGQLVQIDQCMCCTRFEPVYGQVYECLNDLGANVAAILDDNQMSYSNMEDYINMNRVEKYNDGKEDATINLATIQNKDTNDKILKDRWGAGLKVNWNLTAKEDQHPHINWRQSINDDGSSLSKLPTYPGNESNTGQNVVNGKQETRNNSTSRLSQSEIMQKNYDAITKFNGQGNGLTEANIKQIQTWIANAQSYVKGNKDVATTDTQNNAISMAEKYIGTDNTISSSVIVCLNVVTNKGIENTYNEYKKIKSELDTTNPGLIICAMFCGTNLIKELINNAQKTDKDSGGIGQAPGEGVSNIPSSAEQWTIDMCMITSKKTGIPVDWIWAQFCNESGNFKSPCAQHNYGGMSSTSGGWMTFESPTAFGEYMGKVLPRWVGSDGKSTTQAKTMYEYVVALQTDSSPYCASPAGVEPYYAVLKSILGNEGTVVKDKS